tara:strand:- start:51399 stop:52844 length:1446 start_codon:yes stop_codon:yes gene_type:complete
MKLKIYKHIGFLIAAFIISGIQAQKVDKKYTENFKVNKDVLLEINANNADITVTTWNKNEVAVEAIITVEGLSKKEAQEFLKNWKFEALGNKSKVEINANSNRFFYSGDFDFDFDFPEISIPDFDFDFDFDFGDISINIPEFEMPDIKIPEIHLDFDKIWSEIDNYDFDDDDNDDKRTFTYESNGKKKKVVIRSKKEWEAFKKTKDYKDMKKDLKKTLKEAQDKIQNIDIKKIQNEIKKAKIKYDKVDKKKIKESLAKASVSIEKMKKKMAKMYKNGDNVFTIKDGKNNKKVKITRKITIKVPKNAKFDLNTKHSKVKLPKGKTSGKVSYGTFNAEEINGGNLNIYFAPVNIGVLTASTLSLNNTIDAKVASIVNSKITSSSGDLTINNVLNDVDMDLSFGDINILNFDSSIEKFVMNLRQSKAIINLAAFKNNFVVETASSTTENKKNKTMTLNKNFKFKAKNNAIKIEGKYSTLTLKTN